MDDVNKHDAGFQNNFDPDDKTDNWPVLRCLLPAKHSKIEAPWSGEGEKIDNGSKFLEI